MENKTESKTIHGEGLSLIQDESLVDKIDEANNLFSLVRRQSPQIFSAPTHHLKQMVTPVPQLSSFNMVDLPEHEKRVILNNHNLKKGASEKEIRKAFFDEIVDKINAGELTYKVMFALLYELDRQNENRFNGKRAAKGEYLPIVGSKSYVERCIKEDGWDFALTEGWAVLFIDELEFAKFVYQTDHLGGKDIDTIFRPHDIHVKDGKKAKLDKNGNPVIQPQGVIYKMAELRSYALSSTSKDTYIPMSYLKVSKPIYRESDNRKGYIVQLSPTLAVSGIEQFTKMRRSDLEYLFKGRRPSLTFKLFALLAERNQAHAFGYPKYSIDLEGKEGLYNKVATLEQYKKNPKRRMTHLENALNDMVNIQLLKSYKLTKEKLEVEFNSNHNDGRATIELPVEANK